MFSFFKKQNINEGIEEFNKTDNAVLLDVRTKDEYRSGHIVRSKNIEHNNMSKITNITKSKNTPIFVYCQSGSRSSSAVNTLKKMGYTDVRNIGGIGGYSGKIERGN